MTLERLIKDFEKWYTFDPKITPETVVDACSGSVRKKGGPVPVLYADENDALNAWAKTAADLIGSSAAEFSKCTFKWVDKPVMSRFQMTLCDMHNQHRVVEQRFAVESRIGFSGVS